MNEKIKILLPHLVAFFCLLVVSPSFADELTVGNGQGVPPPPPGSENRQVVISLNNSGEVTSMVMDICDVEYIDEHLRIQGCTITGRTDGSCSASEVNECAQVSFSGSIASGDGPIFNLTYNVKLGAPAAECRDLNPQNVVVNGSPFTGQLTSGEFCFVCTADEDCANPNFCWDEICNLDSQDPDYGKCYNLAHCPNDGLYCNGTEFCDEASDICMATDPCDDGVYCNGGPGCDEDNDICIPSGDPCTAPYVCDEGSSGCVLSDVTITLGDFSGFPGSQDNELEVSLLNLDDKVIQFEILIRDEGDYLTCTGCDPVAARCDQNCECLAYENNGLCVVELTCFDYIWIGDYYVYWPILEGDGPVLTVYYDVSGEVPSGGCIDLDPEVSGVVKAWLGGETVVDLVASLVPGEFCITCQGDFNCDGKVTGAELGQFALDFGREDCTDANPPCKGDFNCDGIITGAELGQFALDFGREDCARCDCATCPGYDYCSY